MRMSHRFVGKGLLDLRATDRALTRVQVATGVTAAPPGSQPGREGAAGTRRAFRAVVRTLEAANRYCAGRAFRAVVGTPETANRFCAGGAFRAVVIAAIPTNAIGNRATVAGMPFSRDSGVDTDEHCQSDRQADIKTTHRTLSPEL